MAITATAVWEVRSSATGNAAANGGGGFFKPGATGTDWSQQNDCQYHFTNLTSSGATAVIPTVSAAADMVGNGLHVISGTNATTGWFEILSVVVGTSITVDRNWCTGVVASGVVNIGGCISLNSATANQTDTDLAAAFVAGNTVYVNGALTLAATFTTTTGAAGTPIIITGYNATRGDNPTGSNRPSINAATFTITTGGVNTWKNLRISGSAANLMSVSSQSVTMNCKVVNNSTTATRNAINIATTNATVKDCEAVSYRGNAISITGACAVIGCYVHDSDIGISFNTSTAALIVNNLIESCVTAAFSSANSGTAIGLFWGNTFYGSEAKTGTGIVIAAGFTNWHLTNNIFYGFATGVNDGNAAGITYSDYNCFNNNTTARTNLSTGTHDISSSPAFTSVAQLTGAAGTVSGSNLTVASATGITANQDFVYIISGTGATAGQYLITGVAGNVLTLSSAPGGSGTNINYQITTGRNFAPGANVRSIAFPSAFQAGLTTSYGDLGAAQRDYNVELPTISQVQSGATYASGSLTGTLVSGSKHLGPGRMG